MTVYQQITGNGQVYTGLSTDSKPAGGTNSLSGAMPGDEFLELDTGITYLFDGSAWRPQGAGNTDQKVLTLTAQGVAVQSSDLINAGGAALNLGINVTALTGTTPTLTVTVQGKDFASGTYYNILSSVAISATGFTLLQVGAGLTATANSIANANLPRTWRVSCAIGGTGGPTVTATIGASLIV